MNKKSLLISTLLATLSINAFQAHATAPNTPPPARIPGLEQVIPKQTTQLSLNTPSSIELIEGLVAHYPFSGNADDHSGNENHLAVNGATLTEDRFGMTESAYSFDGKDDYLFTDLDDRKGDFTLSLWAKANDVEQSRYRSVINIHDKTPGSACLLYTSDAADE